MRHGGKGLLALLVVAAAGIATGMWGVGGAGANALETTFASTLTGTTKTTSTATTEPTTTAATTTVATTPSIASFAPTSGSPGTSVLVRGSGLAGATAVAFNGTAASFTVLSDASLTATVPVGATSGRITVQTPAGTLASPTAFTVTAAVGDQAVAYQVDVAHDGVQTDAALNPPFARRWVASFANDPSYPLVAAGKVFVTVSTYPTYGGTLYALDQSDGHVVWSTAIPGTYSFSAAAYDSGQIFVLNFDGILRAFDAATGAQNWIRQLPGQYAFTSPPVAAHGVVYAGGAGTGGTLYAVDEVTGGVISTQSVANGDHSSPSLSDTGVFVGYACNQVYGFAQTTLTPRWHYSTSCSGGGGKTTVYANGDVFTRDVFGNLILDGATGTLLSTYPGTVAPAVDKTTVFALSPSSLVAQSLSTAVTRWTFGGDAQLSAAPLVIVTPYGEFVLVGSASGKLYALDAATGTQIWSADVGGAVLRPDEQNAVTLAGMNAGQGLLVVAAAHSLVAYTGQPTYASDATAPTITVPADVTAEATGPSGAAVPYTATAADPDNTTSQITLTCSPASGSTFPIATTTVTCNAHDPSGNAATPASFHVTVRDTTPPAIATASNITVNATSPSGAAVAYTAPAATDLVDGSVAVSCSPASGALFPNGQTTVSCKATDAHANTASASFVVNVLGAAAQLSALTNAVTTAPELQPPNQKKLRDKLLNDLSQAGQSNLATACQALSQFVADVQAGTAPRGAITAADANAWVASANSIRAARGC